MRLGRCKIAIARCLCALALFPVLANGRLFNGPEPFANTKWGLILGKWSKSLRGRAIANFLGIPYALPPVGDLRFKSPQRWNRMWSTIHNGTVDGQVCPQVNRNFDVVGNEDCLFLNIFVPMKSSQTSSNWQGSAKLPVLVYVHGGGSMYGGGNSERYAPDYLLEQDIILITLNYRLNILGFFSTTNQASPGNYGLKDVLTALEWVQENVHSFEGDAESVTLMGSSAGAAAVYFLVLSKRTEKLFHKYILHSGTALAPWAIHPPRKYRQICLKLAKFVGCLPNEDDGAIASNASIAGHLKGKSGTEGDAYDDISSRDEYYSTKNDEKMMKCMRTVDVTRMLKTLRHFAVWKNNPTSIFGPTLEEDSENAILTMHPIKIIRNRTFRDIPAIMQVVKDEGLLKTLDFFTDPNTEHEMMENFERYLPCLMEQHDAISNTSVFAAAIQNFYFNGNLTLDHKHIITEVVGDGSFMWPAFNTARYHRKMGNAGIYFSLFDYEGTFTHTFSSGILDHIGIAHGDDLNYIFPLLNNKYRDLLLHNTESDITMINIMTEMWVNFMKDGVPRAWMIPAWPDYRDHHKFMRFGIGRSPDIVVQTDFLPDKMEFWEKLMADVLVERDAFVGNVPEETLSGNADAIDCKLTVHITLLIIIALIYIQ